MKKNLLMGYPCSALSNMLFEPCTVLAETPTGCEDSDGYPDKETIGVARSQYGNMMLYRGSTETVQDESEKKIAICTSMRKEEMISALRALADELQDGEL